MLSGRRVLSAPARWPGRLSVGVGLPLLVVVDPAVAAGALGTALPGTSAAVGLLAGVWALLAAAGGSGVALDLALCGLAAALLVVAWSRWPFGRRAAGPASRPLAVVPMDRVAGAAVDAASRLILPRSALTLPDGVSRDDVIACAMRDFVCLQTAWDARDITTLRRLTLPDMLDELLGVLAAHEPAAPRRTDVLTLRADLLACDAIGADYLASVEFTGLIRESPESGAAPFRELWMLTRPAGDESDWRLARQQSLL